MNQSGLPAGPAHESPRAIIDDAVEVVSGEVTDGVLRNPQGEILDADGYPLVYTAEIKVAAIRGLQRGFQMATGQDMDRLRTAQGSSDVIEVQEAAKGRRDMVQAALWRSQRHYNENSVAYHQAALEEDDHRSKENPTPQLPAPSN